MTCTLCNSHVVATGLWYHMLTAVISLNQLLLSQLLMHAELTFRPTTCARHIHPICVRRIYHTTMQPCSSHTVAGLAAQASATALQLCRIHGIYHVSYMFSQHPDSCSSSLGTAIHVQSVSTFSFCCGPPACRASCRLCFLCLIVNLIL